MKIADAVKLAEKSGEVKALEKQGYFLNSAMAFLEAIDRDVVVWNLTYYEPNSNQIVQFAVDDDSVLLKDKGAPMRPSIQKLEMSMVKTSVEKMLAKAEKEYNKFKQPMGQIILTLQKEKDSPSWRFNFITKTLYLITVAIDAKTGKIISSQMSSMVK